MKFSHLMPQTGLRQLQDMQEKAQRAFDCGFNQIAKLPRKAKEALAVKADPKDLEDENKAWAEVMDTMQKVIKMLGDPGQVEASDLLPPSVGKVFKLQSIFMKEFLSLYEQHKENPNEFIKALEELQTAQSFKLERAIGGAAPEERKLFQEWNSCNKTMVKEVKDRFEHLQKINSLNLSTGSNAVDGCNALLVGAVCLGMGGFLCSLGVPIGPPLLALGALFVVAGAGLLGANVKPFVESKAVQKILPYVLPYVPTKIKERLRQSAGVQQAQEEQAKFNEKRSDFVGKVGAIATAVTDAATQSMDHYKKLRM